MTSWEYVDLFIEGQAVKAQAPVIVSASRSTDIPAFYADWFFHRLHQGYSECSLSAFCRYTNKLSPAVLMLLLLDSSFCSDLLHYLSLV